MTVPGVNLLMFPIKIFSKSQMILKSGFVANFLIFLAVQNHFEAIL